MFYGEVRTPLLTQKSFCVGGTVTTVLFQKRPHLPLVNSFCFPCGVFQQQNGPNYNVTHHHQL